MPVEWKYAWRRLLKSPSFAVTAILTLALAIGANAVVFSVLNALVLHTLNVPNAKNFYSIEARGQSLNSYLDYRDVRDRNRSFDGVLAFNFSAAGLDTGGDPSQIWVYEASGNYFDTLGLKPYLGRFFHASDEHGPNSSPYIVLSDAYWRSHFRGDPAVVGRTVQLNKHPFTVLGVAAPDFRGTELFFSPALWVPLVDQEQIEGFSGLNQRTGRNLWVIGRAKPGVTEAQAAADLHSIATYLIGTYPKDDDRMTFSLARPGLLGNLLGRPVRAFVGGLMLLAALILLAACANLGSLFAARAADRSREIALRLALGSSRRHILRQLLTEAILVALFGGVVGIAASVVLLRGLSAWQPLSAFPINLPVSPDALTYVVALLLALASGFLFGLVPVRQILKADPWQVVKTGSTTAAGSRWFSTRDLLLVVQIALCAVLVTSCGRCIATWASNPRTQLW
jgi:predicted permease